MGPEFKDDISSAIVRALNCAFASSNALDWNDRELLAYESLQEAHISSGEGEISRDEVYLGGDWLRPYLVARVDNTTAILSRSEASLSRPALIGKLEVGHCESISKKIILRNGSSYVLWASTMQSGLSLLSLPNVYLTTLTNSSHYRTRRYPLNIARLAQWLRFQHAARVRAADYALDFEGKLGLLIEDITLYRPALVGISLNFGELPVLQELMVAMRQTELRPIICIGNVLAAWISDEVKNTCRDFICAVSASYGELDLEHLCRLLASGASTSVDYLLTDDVARISGLGPTAIVVPDERLLAETLHQGGQASIETSFGCQYGHCTFCPRDHRSKGWRRPAPYDAAAVIERMATLISDSNGSEIGVLSVVDEDAFGQDGRDPVNTPFVTYLVGTAASKHVSCEIYTRLEQILDLSWEKSAALKRLEQLKIMCDSLSRVFVGVESGSDSQLRRYGKGQTTKQVIAALRAGSLLGLPLEFGFITFDPLLTQTELCDSIKFLGRRDILLPSKTTLSPSNIYALATADTICETGKPVFTRVAYMATELEVFVNSPFLQLLRSSAPNLLGRYDPNFARYCYTYCDETIGQVASMCRVWTEGAFQLIYRIRLVSRSVRSSQNPYLLVIDKYRRATYGLLLTLVCDLCENARVQLLPLWADYCGDLPLSPGNPFDLDQLRELWDWVTANQPDLGVGERALFSLERLERRRDS